MPPNLTDWTDIWLGHSGDMCCAGRAGLWWEKSEVGGCDNERPLVTTMLVACPTIKLGPKRRSGHAPRAPKQPPAGPRRLAGLGRRQLLASLGNLEAGPRRWSTRPHGSAAPGLGRRQRPVINWTFQIVLVSLSRATDIASQNSIVKLDIVAGSIFYSRGRIPPTPPHLPRPAKAGWPTNGAPQLPPGHSQRNTRKQHRKLTLPPRTP